MSDTQSSSSSSSPPSAPSTPSTPTSATPLPSYQISAAYDDVIVDTLMLTTVVTAAFGAAGMALTRSGSGYRLGSVMAGLGFGVGYGANRGYRVGR
mmetsp:Transcript_18551/g.37164  ORF Transcript_18551/g.37164 Transcript_18551/m.37164 type:complete len:96 (-) Transcript_18551:110-397(-)